MDALDDFLYVATCGDEMYVVLVFVDIIAEHLLALFVDHVDVVNDDHLLFAINCTMGLAERLHIIAVELDALFFERVDKHYIGLGDGLRARESVVLANNRAEERRFSGADIAYYQGVQIVDFKEGFQDRRNIVFGVSLMAELVDRVGFVFGDECGWYCHWMFGCLDVWMFGYNYMVRFIFVYQIVI